MVNNDLLVSLRRLSQLQKAPLNTVDLQEAVSATADINDAANQLAVITSHLGLSATKHLKRPGKEVMMGLVCSDSEGWGLLRGHNALNEWVTERWNDAAQQWVETTSEDLLQDAVFTLNLVKPYTVSNSPVFDLISTELFRYKAVLINAILGGVIINTVALTTSLYTMQVYDRVVPTGSTQTLLVLSLGVLVAIGIEFFTKTLRMRLYEKLVAQVDQRLSRSVFMRFLSVRLDQLPPSVGSLATQMRGYETIRSFLTTVTTHLVIDAPFSLFYGVVIFALAGKLALIPIIFFIVCVLIGLYYRNRVDALAGKANAAANFKTGLLVEAVEGAETIKSGQGGWRMLSKWMNTTDEARDYEQEMGRVSEHSQHLVASLQQCSYILLVAFGALLITEGEITMGALIACSILSGRILSPVASIPRMLVQWAHTKAALKGLDALWALEADHSEAEQPIVLEQLAGHYMLSDVQASYGSNKALSMSTLSIKAGEKIGVIGSVGAGKTTLLRLLSGMYKPHQGRILLDDVDINKLSKPVLAEHVGFLQQEGRLFAGTVRENLILGLIDPGNDVILEAARVTGLLNAVITPHPDGLQQRIFEGGTGLSGGQRQLVNLTRVYLAKPRIWLLDEPTASMDQQLEHRTRNVLHETLSPEDTLVIVTHKPEMLALVDRLIVIINHTIVMDGPRDGVLDQLGKANRQRTNGMVTQPQIRG